MQSATGSTTTPSARTRPSPGIGRTTSTSASQTRASPTFPSPKSCQLLDAEHADQLPERTRQYERDSVELQRAHEAQARLYDERDPEAKAHVGIGIPGKLRCCAAISWPKEICRLETQGVIHSDSGDSPAFWASAVISSNV
jgi:hypothetical protein